VSRIDPTNNTSTSLPVGKEPVGIAYGAGSIWVANSGDGTISRIDPRTSKVLATIRIGNSPQGVEFDAKRGLVWVTVQAADGAS